MSYEQVKSVLDAHSNALMAREDCVGCGIGMTSDGKEHIIMIYALNKEAQFPSTLSWNGLTVNTEITVTGRITAGG